MITTEHMGLVLWDLEKDDFEHSKLADNFVKIDQHNHAGLVTEGKFKNEDTEEAAKETPTAKSDILNYAEDNAGVAKWEAVGQGEGIRTPEVTSPTDTAIKPESIWRYLLALRSVGHRQLDEAGVWPENIKDEAVERRHIKLNAVCTPQIEDGCVTGPKLEKGLLPLGIVVSWYKTPAEPSPGPKWAVCEGQEWKTVDNELGAGYAKLEVGNLPPLLNKFIRGTTMAGIGETGGKSLLALAHTHVVNGHTHTINPHSHTVNSHTHSIGLEGSEIDNGLHNHTFFGTDEPESASHNLHSRTTAFSEIFTVKDTGGGSHTNKFKSMFVSGYHELENIDHEINMTRHGVHNHSGHTGPTEPGTSSVGLETNATAPGTNSALETYNIEPPWYGLCQIIRVKR